MNSTLSLLAFSCGNSVSPSLICRLRHEAESRPENKFAFENYLLQIAFIGRSVLQNSCPESLIGRPNNTLKTIQVSCSSPISSELTAVVGSTAVEAKKEGMRVVVIGGGVGGLHVAGRMAKEGYIVTLFEKNANVGGRLQSVEIEGGFRFDTGPSLLLMPQKYREAFKDLGENLDDHVTLKRVEPAAYRVFFGSEGDLSSADMLYDVQQMCGQLEKFESGASAAYLRFLAASREALEKGTLNFIERDFRTFWDYADIPRLLPLLRHLSPLALLGQHWVQMGSYFKDPRLKALFTFQDLYVGLSPFNAPGAFSLLAATEITDGVWYPIGGFQKIRNALFQIATNLGVTMRLGISVEKILVEHDKVVGVELPGGEISEADIVVANADLPYVYSDLLADADVAKGKAKRLVAMDYSAGVIAFHWGLDKRMERLNHHNIFLSDKFEDSWRRAVGPLTLTERPNFYVHAPARTDPSASPEGGDAITVLFPVANLGEIGAKEILSNYEKFIDAAREKVLKSFENSGFGDLGPHILSETVCSPPEWEKLYNLKYGAAFGLSHNLLQLAYFRPDVADDKISGLYFVGASTRPGNGVPLVLMGAKTTVERIFSDLKEAAGY